MVEAAVIGKALGITGFWSYVAAFAVNYAISVQVTRIFGEKPPSQSDQGTRQQIPPNTANALPTVYGDAYIGGTFVDAALTTDQTTMYYVLAVSCISSNGTFTFDQTKMYYGDRLITFGTGPNVASLTDQAGNVDTSVGVNSRLQIYLYTSNDAGVITNVNSSLSPSQVMGSSSGLASSEQWTGTRQMNGLAFAIVRLVYDRTAQTTQLQPITFKVTQNLNGLDRARPGDVWYDYMTNQYYGGAVDPDFIDTSTRDALNTYSDQTITYTPSGGGTATQRRYKINGVINAGQTVLSNIDKILSASDSWMAYSPPTGKWSIVINKAESTAYSFNDNNIIGELRVSATDITNSVNVVEASFPNKDNKDQTAYVNLDLAVLNPSLLYPNEPVNKATIALDLVNNNVQAYYLANRILEQAREDLVISFGTTYYGIQVNAGDVISVTNSGYGWTNKLFRVVKVNEASLQDGTLAAKIDATEYNAQVYDDQNITAFTPVPNSGLPSPAYFSALSAPTVVSNNYNVTPPTFTVQVTVPAVGRVTYGTLYYTTSASPTGFDWKELAKATTPLGTAAVNGATYDFANLTLAGGTYYFSYVVGNEIGQSAKSATSSAFSWSPINSESGNVAYLEGEIDTLGIDVADKVSKTTANILTGTITPQDSGGIKVGSITWSSTTGQLTGGSGIAITEAGIIGAKSGVANFTIDTSGNALFKGDINTNGDAYFEGSNPSVTSVFIDGQNYTIDYSSYSRGTTQPTVLNSARVGTFGYAQAIPYVGSGYTGWNVGTMGVGKSFFGSKGIGLVGQGDEFGAYISGYTAGLVCSASTGSVSNVALQINNNGRFVWNGYYIDAPTGSTSLFLRNDGTWATAGAGAGVSSFNSRTGAVTFQTSDMTGTAPGSAYYLSGSGWASVSSIMTTATANSGSATVSGNNMNLLGSTSTGIAGAYVGTSGSGSTVTFTVQTTSPSDIRLKEEVADADVGLEFVKNLRPVSYKLKADPRHQKGYGFIADEVEQLGVYGSSLVYEEPNWQVGDEVGFKTIHYPSYIAVLTKAVQELSAKVDEQQKMIEALQNKG